MTKNVRAYIIYRYRLDGFTFIIFTTIIYTTTILTIFEEIWCICLQYQSMGIKYLSLLSTIVHIEYNISRFLIREKFEYTTKTWIGRCEATRAFLDGHCLIVHRY